MVSITVEYLAQSARLRAHTKHGSVGARRFPERTAGGLVDAPGGAHTAASRAERGDRRIQIALILPMQTLARVSVGARGRVSMSAGAAALRAHIAHVRRVLYALRVVGPSAALGMFVHTECAIALSARARAYDGRRVGLDAPPFVCPPRAVHAEVRALRLADAAA